MTTTPIPTMKVRVGNRGNSGSYEGVWVTTVIIKKICPVCGGPRGDKRDGRIIEDGEYYYVDNWDNPCGHHDWYGQVLKEAGIHPYADPARPRLILFGAEDDDGRDVIHAYQVPQDAWRRDLAEAEAEQYGEPEVWALPEDVTASAAGRRS